MSATARVTILMTQKEKNQLIGKARKAGFDSLSEYLRRKARLPDELNDSTLDVLLAEVHESTARANAALDRALASTAEYRKRWGIDDQPATVAPAGKAAKRGARA